MKPTIHEIIHKQRIAHGLSQRKLADHLGVSCQAVSKWECGKSLPDILLLPALCDILGISADELLQISGSSRRDEREE